MSKSTKSAGSLPNADEWKARGNDAVKAGKHDVAVECYTSGLSADGGDKGVLFSNRAHCLHKLGRYEEAANDAKQCIALKPDFVKGYIRGAMSLRALKRPEEALAMLKQGPKHEESEQLAATLRPEAALAEKARIKTLKGPEKGKEEGNVFFRQGLFEFALKKYDEALKQCKDQEAPMALALRNNRAACNHQLSDFSAVVNDTNFVLEREPGNLKALARRMLALEPQEKYEKALEDARAILRQAPNDEKANNVQHRLGKIVRDMKKAGA